MDAERVEFVLESTKESSCKSPCIRPMCCPSGFVLIAKCYSVGLVLEEKNHKSHKAKFEDIKL